MKHKFFNLNGILKLFKNIYATSGELTVIGENHITFEVKCNNPKKLHVCFADPQPVPIPCVPFVEDTLMVTFEKIKGPLSEVTIYWKVSDTRLIAWTVKPD